MKKSDLVLELTEYMKGDLDILLSEGNINKEDRSSLIISFLEHKGMLPSHNGHAEKMCIKEMDILLNFKWEPEEPEFIMHPDGVEIK